MTVTPEEMAQLAYDGHPDDVRTMLGLMIVLDGMIHEVITDYFGTPDDLDDADKLVALARAWDGLDGQADTAVLREALMVLHRREAAIPR